jgi:hypothetical protein
MTTVERAAAVRGKTIRLTWTEGPTKGRTYEHVFHEDGTVEWHDAAAGEIVRDRSRQAVKEKPEYAGVRVADDIYLVSYLAASGYTLTVALNFREKKMVGFASSAKEWFPLTGTFEVVR